MEEVYMSNKTFGLKVPDELYNEASNLMSVLDVSGEEFLNTLIASYKTEKTKEQIPLVAKDIKELQGLTRRIFDIYLNLSYGIENIARDKEEEMNNKLEKKDSIIFSLQEELNQLTDKSENITTAFNEAVEDKNILEKEVNQLTETLRSNKDLIQEYKNKNDMLLGQLTQYEKYPEKLEATKELLNKQQADNIELSNNLKQAEQTIEQLNKAVDEAKTSHVSEVDMLNTSHSSEIDKLNTIHSVELDKLTKDHEADLKSLKDKLEIEKDKSILELKQIRQQEIEKIQNKHNTDISKYNAEYKKLLEELDKSRQSSQITKKPSAYSKQTK
jgi:chromosome segregation ATPase